MKLSLSYSLENDLGNYQYFIRGKSKYSYGRENFLQSIIDQAPKKIKELSPLDPELENKISDVLKEDDPDPVF